jgi:hypothetical protein
VALERKRTRLEGEQESGSVEERFTTARGRVTVRFTTPDDELAQAHQAALRQMGAGVVAASSVAASSELSDETAVGEEGER